MLTDKHENFVLESPVLYTLKDHWRLSQRSGGRRLHGACFRLKFQNHFHPSIYRDGSFIKIKNKSI